MSLKRFLSILSVSAALLALTACGGAAPSASPSPTAESQEGSGLGTAPGPCELCGYCGPHCSRW